MKTGQEEFVVLKFESKENLRKFSDILLDSELGHLVSVNKMPDGHKEKKKNASEAAEGDLFRQWGSTSADTPKKGVYDWGRD